MLLVVSFFGKCFIVVFLGILKEMCECFVMGCIDCIVRDCVLSLARVPPPLPENNPFAIIFSLPSFAGGNYSIPVLREGVGGTPTPACKEMFGGYVMGCVDFPSRTVESSAEGAERLYGSTRQLIKIGLNVFRFSLM